MTLLYCFANASLTRRVLRYLAKKLRKHITYVTVIFFNDFWIVQLKLKPAIARDSLQDCQAFLNENGHPYQGCPWMRQVLEELDAGCDPTAVMNFHHIAIISHGAPQFEEISHFKEKFVRGLGYCPPSLV